MFKLKLLWVMRNRFLLVGALVLAISMIIVETSVSSRNFEYTIYAGVALFLGAAALTARMLTVRSQGEGQVVERKAGSNKISPSLVALSSAAILAVYAAGYQRTSTAADRFAAQAAAARRRAVHVGEAVMTQMAAPAITTTPNRSSQNVAASAPAVAAHTILPPTSATSPVVPTGSPASAPSATGMALSAAAVPPTVPAGNAAVVAADQRTLEPTPAAAPALAALQPKDNEYADGAYLGWGRCRHGEIQVKVVIVAGRISSADVSRCETRYPCTYIRRVPPQVVAWQDPGAIDNVSGATESVDAYYEALIEALSKALK